MELRLTDQWTIAALSSSQRKRPPGCTADEDFSVYHACKDPCPSAVSRSTPPAPRHVSSSNRLPNHISPPQPHNSTTTTSGYREDQQSMSYETVRYGTIETTQPDGPPEIISVTEVTRIRRRQRTSSVLGGICCCLFILLVVVALLYVGFMLFMFMAYDCTGIVRPPVFGRPTWANFKNETFHVGFDLTAGYG